MVILLLMRQKYKANEYDLIAIEHASTIIKLEIQREISNDEIEKVQNNLVWILSIIILIIRTNLGREENFLAGVLRDMSVP